MIRRLDVWLLVLALALPGLVAADKPAPDQPEAPVRLKKKDTPKPPEAAPDKKPEAPAKEGDVKEGKGDPGETPADPDEEMKETLARVSKNMRASEEHLAKDDPGDSTRQVQRDILDDLDSLIKQTQQQQQDSNSGTSSRQGGQPKNSGQPKAGQKTAGGKKPGKGTGAKPSDQAKGAGDKKTGQAAQPTEGTAGKGGQGGQSSKGESSKMADLYKDVWGHLPETMRLEMDQYSREEFMAKYNDLLKQYYSTIARKGQHKEE